MIIFGLSTFNRSDAHNKSQFFLGLPKWNLILKVQSLRYLLPQCSQIVMPIIFRSVASFTAEVRQKSLSATKNKRLFCNPECLMAKISRNNRPFLVAQPKLLMNLAISNSQGKQKFVSVLLTRVVLRLIGTLMSLINPSKRTLCQPSSKAYIIYTYDN